jgi:hypothetical protein
MAPSRIGFAVLYAWRPHVEHAHFLASIAEQGGHVAFHLACDADLPNCYTHQLRDRPHWQECLKCRAGAIRSYTGTRVSAIGDYLGQDDAVAEREWAYSSASTLGRFESAEEYASPAFRELVDRLLPAVERAYRAARAWIRAQRLDAVCVFNGRMDATRGILEAARSLGVRVISMERTWFSHGLQLYPEESCLGLRSVDRLVGEWRDRPLTERQARAAASYPASRFLRRNTTEWRAYNVDGKAAAWPVTGGRRRILLIPSSVNEVWGHPDWKSGWSDPLAAYDALVAQLGLQPADLLLRCHPNWAENIGHQGGERSERHYLQWARSRGVAAIASGEKTSTLGLIEQCDAIVVAGGSAALEAGMLGKQVIGIAPSTYQEAGLRDAATDPASLAQLRLHDTLPEAERGARARRIARQTLRFAYTMIHRVPQYVDEVRAETTTRFRYDMGADPARFIELIRTGVLQPDDADFAADERAEDDVLRCVAEGCWEELAQPPELPLRKRVPIRRRLIFRSVDLVRDRMPLGDR